MNNAVEDAIEKYIKCAAIHGECTESGDFKQGNKAHDKLLKALSQIRAAGDLGRQALVALLQHENASVRLWSATHLLKTDPAIAIEKIKEIAVGHGMIALCAETVLSEFAKRTLQIP